MVPRTPGLRGPGSSCCATAAWASKPGPQLTNTALSLVEEMWRATPSSPETLSRCPLFSCSPWKGYFRGGCGGPEDGASSVDSQLALLLLAGPPWSGRSPSPGFLSFSLLFSKMSPQLDSRMLLVVLAVEFNTWVLA